MRRAGFAIVGIFLLKEELNGSIFLHTAVGLAQIAPLLQTLAG